MSESTSTSGPASSAKDPTSKRDLTGAISKMCGWFGGLAGRVKDGLPQVLGKAKGPQPPTTGKKPPKPWNSWWSKRSKRARLGLLIGGPLAVIVLAGLVVFLVLFLRPVFVVAAVEADDAVVSGEDVLVSVDVANEGRTTGDYELSVLVDGEEAWAELVTLDGGTEEQVPIRLSGLSAGRYEISLAEWPESAQEVWVMTPAEFEIDRVEVQPDSIDFNTTNEAEVLVGFTNVGEAKGSYELEFALNGEVVEVREIELEGGLSADETFAVTVTEPGTCEVAVNDELADLEVYKIERPRNGTELVNEVSGGPNRLKIINNHDDSDCVVILSAASMEGQPPLLAAYVRAGSTHTVRRIKDGTYICYYAIGEDWCAYRQEFTSVWDRGRFDEPMEAESPGWSYMVFTVEFGLATGESWPPEDESSSTQDLGGDDFPDLSAGADTPTGSPSTTPTSVEALPPIPVPDVLWKFRTSNWVYSDPAVSGGVVYFGSRDRYIYAVDAITGEQRWKFKTGGEVFSSPTVSGGVVYCGSDDDYVYAIDATTGELEWKFETGANVVSSPAVSDGVVFFGSRDHYFYALDAASGQEKWKFKTGFHVTSSPAVSGGVVYFGSQVRRLYALDADTGEEKWKFLTDGSVDSSPTVWEGKVYFAGGDYFYAVDADTGEQKWRFEANGSVVCRPAVSDGAVYFGDSRDYVYALDAQSGWEKWNYRTRGEVDSSPAVSGGTVYFGSQDHHFYALDAASGQERWKFRTGDDVTSSPAIANGVIYFGSWDKHLYALDIR